MIKNYSLGFIFLFLWHGMAFAQLADNDPDPQRFEQEINQFKQWDAKNSYPEQAILFVGSSSIRMWKTYEAFSGYPVINRGFGGSHISDVQYFYEQVIKKYNPSVIIFYAGDNDVAAEKPVAQVIGDYKELTDRILQDFPDLTFVYIPIKPSSSRWSFWPQMRKTNQQIEAYNGQNSQLHYLDLATPLLDEDGKPRDALFIEDRLHLNEDGYAVWNQILRPNLKDWFK